MLDKTLDENINLSPISMPCLTQPELLQIKEITLEVKELINTGKLSKELLSQSIGDDGYETIIISMTIEELIITLRRYVLGIDSKQKEVIVFPATCWNYFKDSLFPEFLKKIFPVRYKTITITAKAFFPNLNIPGHPPSFRLNKEVKFQYHE